jgi:hypothetical protein
VVDHAREQTPLVDKYYSPCSPPRLSCAICVGGLWGVTSDDEFSTKKGLRDFFD